MGDIRRILDIYGMDDELMNECIIEVSGLKKSYGAVPAVNGITFSVCKGQLAALLGPNGAGKSTVVNILSTIIGFDEGSVIIAGEDISRNGRKTRKNIGVVFQNGVLDERLTVYENLRVRGDFYGVRGKQLNGHIEEAAEMTGIQEIMDRFYGTLSGGQKRRCDIARALLHSPKILFLDEPTAGLDPHMRNSIWDTIDIIRQRTGMTVMMTTHYMEEAAAADNILVMKKGDIVFDGSPYRLKEMFSKDQLILYLAHKTEKITLSDTKDALRILEEQKGRYDSFEVIKGSMDAAYMAVISD